MNKMLFAFAFVLGSLMFWACTKAPKDLEIPKKSFPPASYLVYEGDQKLIDSFIGSGPILLYPNVITPDGHGPESNEEFGLITGGGLIKFNWRNLTIYNKRKNVVKVLSEQEKWDGTNENGEVEVGQYGFSVELFFENEKTVLAYGAFAVRQCILKTDDINSAVFADNIHPRLGVILPTQESIEPCD